ncbi:MAG TPA: FixH family protein [Methyloradius sp.]
MLLLPQIAMSETLFGGLLAAAFIFFITRALGLSNFWAGILSGVLPFLSYLYYANQHWAGGDVMAIHFALYLANAGLLIVFGSMQQKQQTMHWAPRLIIGFFIALVLINITFLSVSTRGVPDVIANLFLPNPDNEEVHTVFPGIIPHDRNILYAPHLDQMEQQKQLGWQVTVTGFEKIKRQSQRTISINVQDAQKQPITHAEVTIAFWRMANSFDDQKLVFKETTPGVYQADLTLTAEGRWITELYIQQGDNDFVKRQSLYVDGD